MKKLILRLISKLIFIIEKDELKHLSLDEQDSRKKIIDDFQFSETQYLTKTDTGYHPISNLYRTQPYTEWKITTESNKELVCADHHLLFTPAYKVIRTSNLFSGDEILTEHGIEKVKSCYPTNRKSTMYDCMVMSPDHRYYTNGIISHNTVTVSIFITWYLLFNIDKNVIVLANKGATSAEILDKIKAVVKGLPFFLKPGILQNNVMTMRLDNGCRIMCQATTKTAAIGFTIHLAYMDEFAHIQDSFVEPFYRSVYPTIAASKISKVIITSTPCGKNKFYQIYQGSLDKANEYANFRVDWWEVPDRDDEWKKREIGNLGSEELFNQEYGNQFLAGDSLLLSGDALRAMQRVVRKYEFKELLDFEYEDIDYRNLTWHPNFDPDDVNVEIDRFVFSIDLADGAGKDYSIINIFKIVPLSPVAIKKLRRDRVEDEASMFRLLQIGIYRSNKADVDEVAKICEILVFKIFNEDIVRIALEMNFKGDIFIEKFAKNEKYYEEIFLYTKHNEKTNNFAVGIKIHKNNKLFFCREFRKLVLDRRIILNEKQTFDEMNNFGVNSRGGYSSQSGHDDIAMTSVNLVPMIISNAFSELIEETFEFLDDKIKEAMQKKLSEIDSNGKDESPFNYVKDISSNMNMPFALKYKL